ncbi:hypothetical protein PSPO01_09589 [Paraphaeosphaeria sporulosa]
MRRIRPPHPSSRYPQLPKAVHAAIHLVLHLTPFAAISSVVSKAEVATLARIESDPITRFLTRRCARHGRPAPPSRIKHSSRWVNHLLAPSPHTPGQNRQAHDTMLGMYTAAQTPTPEQAGKWCNGIPETSFEDDLPQLSITAMPIARQPRRDKR